MPEAAGLPWFHLLSHRTRTFRNTTMVRALIFDIGNVLIPVDYERARERLRGLVLSPAQEKQLAAICIEHEHGRLGRSEFLTALKGIFQYDGTEDSLLEIWCDIFAANSVLHQLIPRLARTYPLYLLSNTGPIHREFLERHYSVFAHFLSAVYSYEVGVMKPNPRIYQIAEEQFGVTPEETLFIDDLPQNVEAARKAGFQGFVYDWQRHDLFEAELLSRNLHH